LSQNAGYFGRLGLFVNLTSPLFVFIVMPVVLGGYWLCPRGWRNTFLLAVGLALYSWGAPEFVLAVLLLASVDWVLAFRIAASPPKSPTRNALTALGIVLNLGLLVAAKYANFGVAILNDVRYGLDLAPVPWTEVALPIGVSFVVFEKISYLVDVARGTVLPLRSLRSYLLYTFLFPKMLAGPIVRFHTIEHQLTHRSDDDDDRAYGLSRLALGLAKKALIADTLGAVANDVFRLPARELGMPTAWLGALCFTLQIYFDFSGYSDMAIGMARWFGFRLPENFAHPYTARSPREFWTRWHISLSSWIRDYLYVPLGGNRRGELRTALNLWVCFLSCGLWHGANWTYLAWGALHGVALTVNRYYDRHVERPMPRALAVLFTFTFVTLTFVVFRSPSVLEATSYYRALFSAPTALSFQVPMDEVAQLAFAVGIVLSFAPSFPGFAEVHTRFAEGGRSRLLLKTCAVPLLLLAMARTLASEATSFIYFRF
jgi:alginate O-acetyltransferase complex protein AlgI